MYGYSGYPGMGGYPAMGGIGGGAGFNAWTWIILILIVLQWFRVGYGGGVGGPGGVLPENSLLCNGGLFIITIFLLVAYGCFRGPAAPIAPIAPVRYC
jgi:hypothetical protein